MRLPPGFCPGPAGVAYSAPHTPNLKRLGHTPVTTLLKNRSRATDSNQHKQSHLCTDVHAGTVTCRHCLWGMSRLATFRRRKSAVNVLLYTIFTTNVCILYVLSVYGCCTPSHFEYWAFSFSPLTPQLPQLYK